MSYAWVSEGSIKKYDRAVAELKKVNQPITEEAVKALYVKYNGLVLSVKQQIEVKAKKSKKK